MFHMGHTWGQTRLGNTLCIGGADPLQLQSGALGTRPTCVCSKCSGLNAEFENAKPKRFGPPPPPTPFRTPSGACLDPQCVPAGHPSHQTFLPYLSLKVKVASLGVTGFHGVTGGVFKAWERIHHRVADQRLLAIPSSCKRGAIYNPLFPFVLGAGIFVPGQEVQVLVSLQSGWAATHPILTALHGQPGERVEARGRRTHSPLAGRLPTAPGPERHPTGAAACRPQHCPEDRMR